MKKLTVRVTSEAKAPLKLISVVLTFTLTTLPILIYYVGHDTFQLNASPFIEASLIGCTLLITNISFIYICSRFSPVKQLRLRKKLALFTEQLTKQTQDGKLKHSVEWNYKIVENKMIIELFSSGLISDKSQLGMQLSEYLRENLLEYKELSNCVRFTFGEFPQRLNGIEVLIDEKL